MSPISLKKLLLMSLMSTFFVGGTSKPAASPNSHYAEDALGKRIGPDILKTTTTDYHTIDWIRIESQGEIARAPPPRTPYTVDPARNISLASPELQLSGAELGPRGTVPIPRSNLTPNNSKKGLPPKQSSKEKSKRQYSGDHWYCSSDTFVNNLGGSAVYSAYDAWVENPADFSLLQIAVTVAETSKGEQTVEAGWINYPDQETAPHLFTYYTTDGYTGNGNYIGGWNREVAGWVQYSSTIFPGSYFAPLSQIDGPQHEIAIEYLLYEGNWWLAVQNEWIGYYPGSMFSIEGELTLADYSDLIYFYGEVYQTESALTTTDMGSGEFGTSGWPWAAYMHNIVYDDLSGDAIEWNAPYWCSDTSRYNVEYFPDSGSSWGTYVFIGGPGAGGVVGG
jgi:hypothetical protein